MRYHRTRYETAQSGATGKEPWHPQRPRRALLAWSAAGIAAMGIYAIGRLEFAGEFANDTFGSTVHRRRINYALAVIKRTASRRVSSPGMSLLRFVISSRVETPVSLFRG